MNRRDKVRISLIGDIFPGELSYTQNYGIRTQFEKHKGIPWITRINEIVGVNDLVIGNLESPLIDEDKTVKKTFFGHPGFASFLKNSGIDVVNVANNHILEQGSHGFKSTINILNNGKLDSVGHTEGNKSKINYKQIKGLKIAIAGFSNVDLNVIQNDNHFATLNEDNVIDTLKMMKQQNADIKILCFHWGDEYIHVPSLEQRMMAYRFIDNGADIIAGHHPHVIQPYEEYKNRHIFYSLGNFIFDYIHSEMVSIGLVAFIEIDSRKQFDIKLEGVKLSYKETVSTIPTVKFQRYYSKITKQYDKFITLSDIDYKNQYIKLHKKNRFQIRIVMKLSLLIEFFRINSKDKIYLIKNLFTYYYNILKRVVKRTISTIYYKHDSI
jgi:poly-gamma-glutamate synthesis protein (capsule biosynthesis protein)